MEKNGLNSNDTDPDDERMQGSTALSSWTSFWDIGSPVDGAAGLARLYGPGATKAAVCCALTARADGRTDDCRFWFSVMLELCPGPVGPQTPGSSQGLPGTDVP